MTSLHERFASTDDGARRLAVARLRREVLKTLHRALKASGLSQVDLARRLGVRKSAVSQVLNGDGNVRITTLAEYLYATGHEMKLAIVPAGQPRADVLARRAGVATARHPYSTAEQVTRNAPAFAGIVLSVNVTLGSGPNQRMKRGQVTATPTHSVLPQGADWSPFPMGERHIEPSSVETK